MTSIKDSEQHDHETDITDHSRITLSVVFILGGFLVTGILMFGRLEARVDVLDSNQKIEKERLDRHEVAEAERLQRIEDKLDRVLERVNRQP